MSALPIRWSPYGLVRGLVSVLFRLVWRPTLTGMENIPGHGPVIIASNHLSFVDSVVIPTVVPRRVRFLAKSDYFTGTGLKGWLTALFFRSVDAVPVQRDDGRESMAALKTALGVLQAGHAFGLYPEGTRSRDGRLYRGRTGVGWLALESGAPIVPVCLVGTNDVNPIGANRLHVRPVSVSFGEPVDPAPWIARVRERGGAGQARREITDLVMQRIAAMSPQEPAGVYNDRSAQAASVPS